jgi:hypothetical protein
MDRCERDARTTRPTLLGVPVLVLFGVACSTPSIRPQVLVNSLELDGDIGTSFGPLSTDNSVEALGLDDSETVIVPRADLDWDPIHVSIEGFQMEVSGTGVAEASLDIGDGPGISIGEPVDSEADFELYQARFVWDFVPDPLLDLGLGVGVGYLDYEISVQSLAGGGVVSGSDDLPFAFLAGRAAKTIGDFELLVLAGGGAIEIDDEDYKYLDVEAMVNWGFWQVGPATAELALGYRYIRYEYEFDAGQGEFDLDLTLDGPFVGLSARF